MVVLKMPKFPKIWGISVVYVQLFEDWKKKYVFEDKLRAKFY